MLTFQQHFLKSDTALILLRKKRNFFSSVDANIEELLHLVLRLNFQNVCFFQGKSYKFSQQSQ